MQIIRSLENPVILALHIMNNVVLQPRSCQVNNDHKTTVPINDLIIKCLPLYLKPVINSGIFIASIAIPTGILSLDTWNTTVASPETPPGAILNGIRNIFMDRASIKAPKKSGVVM